ncbi:MAG: histidine phosphatase family protein [Promethearchaeota archaeon]
MVISNTWEDLDWTYQAVKLIAGLVNFPRNSKIILLLRHSERDVPESVWDNKDLQLTTTGHRLARKLGENLPIDRIVRFFTSHATRCQDTAEDILNGFLKVGGKGEIQGNLEPLYNIGIERNFFLKQIEDGDLVKYVQNWISGNFPEDKIQPLISYSISTANIIWSLFNESPSRSIDIHVTHEIPIMGLRFGWFNIVPDDKWVNYLGGLAFTLQNDNFLLFDIDRFLTVKIPAWWDI